MCFTRDPSTGEKIFFGDFLLNAQGEDVVAGIRTPLHLSELKKLMPKVYKQLEKRARETREALSRHAGHGVHGRERQALHAADAHGKAHRLRRHFELPWTWPTRGLIKVEEALETSQV